jgi:hypothetical protein
MRTLYCSKHSALDVVCLEPSSRIHVRNLGMPRSASSRVTSIFLGDVLPSSQREDTDSLESERQSIACGFATPQVIGCEQE